LIAHRLRGHVPSKDMGPSLPIQRPQAATPGGPPCRFAHGAGSETARSRRWSVETERWVRSGRSECLVWTLVWNQHQLRRALIEYLRHDNGVRPQRSLDLQLPIGAGRLTLVKALPTVRRVDILGGPIHEHRHAA
jgi:hypothetical protein